MSTLAIKGHATRGKEIIEILEMLGGDNTIKYDGSYTRCYYFLDDTLICSTYGRPHLQCYTLEEFLEKYPYKVGDKVTIKERDKVVTITDMSWRNGREIIYETIHNGDCYECFPAEELQPYKEQETMEVPTIKLAPEQLDGAQVIIPIPQGYEFAGVDDDNRQVIFEKIGYHYPKNYKECCDVLKIPNDERYIDIDVPLDYNKLLSAFTELLICRTAYWKIAGEQMGLGKPWEPDWDNEDEYKYGFFRLRNIIYKDATCINPTLLVFPTEEMRDAFYENFKDLIERCKELL